MIGDEVELEMEEYMLENPTEEREEQMVADAKKLELERLDEFNVYEVVDWQQDKKKISSKWEITKKREP